MIKAGVKNDGPKPEGMEKMIEIYNLTKITSNFPLPRKQLEG